MKRYPFLDLKELNRPIMDELKKAASDVIESGRYIGGAENDRLSKELCELCGMKHCVPVSNGLDALRLILRSMIIDKQLSPGDEIIVPANTYIASILAITDAGLVPVLAEPNLQTMCLDSDRIESMIGQRTAAIMTVHLYGRVCWDKKLKQVAERYGLKIIEDAAQAIGAKSSICGMNGIKNAGSLGDAAAISFYPTKNIGALGDAGAVVTNNSRLAQTVEALANYGSDRRYHNIFEGFNCRMDPIQAAMLRVKLKYIANENNGRLERARLYHRLIGNDLITTPEWDDGCVWHQYVIRCRERDRLKEWLESNGVMTDIHYPVAPHQQPCYAHLRHEPLPVTERLASEILSLPISTATPLDDIAEIAGIINKFQ